MANSPVLPPLRTAGCVTVESASTLCKGEVPEKDIFDPVKHINFIPPSKVHTMQELGFSETTGVSPIAVSEPFHLFTSEAVRQMRAEILSSKVWDNCQYSSNLAQCQLRGFASR